MDLFRADWKEFSRAMGAAVESNLDEEMFLAQPLPEAIGQEERRMQMRAYAHWARLRGRHTFPPIADLALEQLPAIAGHAVLLDFSDGIENPIISFLGEELARECGEMSPIRRLWDIPVSSLLSRIAQNYEQIIAYQAPVAFEAEFVNNKRRTSFYRGMLLPFGGEDGAISHVLGVLNWKELAGEDMATSLLAELRQAYVPAPLETLASTGASTGANAGASHPDLAQIASAQCQEPSLQDWLISAKALARAARRGPDHGHAALYAAIGASWDFALAAQDEPEQYDRLLVDAGLKGQARAPLLPLLKLVFGPGHDKTRLTEYAAVLAHARRRGIGRGRLAGWLAATPGGLKGLVYEERRARLLQTDDRRGPGGRQKPARERALAERLRRIRPRPLDSLDPVGEEFAVLLARRLGNGEVVLLGEVVSELPLLERVARHLP